MTSLKALINAAVFVNGSRVFVTPAASSGVTSHSSPLSDPEVLLVLVLPRRDSALRFGLFVSDCSASEGRLLPENSPLLESVGAATQRLCVRWHLRSLRHISPGSRRGFPASARTAPRCRGGRRKLEARQIEEEEEEEEAKKVRFVRSQEAQQHRL